MLSKITIAGGGLAGLAAAIELRRAEVDVEVFEKRKYPCVKLCGEFLSLEGVEALMRLSGLGFAELTRELDLVPLDTFAWVSRSGRSLEMPLEPKGVGVRRDRLDFWLAQKAQALGAKIRFGEAHAAGAEAPAVANVLWATGKDHGESPYFAVKGYCKGESRHAISLYQLKGGYIGFTRLRASTSSTYELSYCALLDRRKVNRAWKFTNWRQLCEGVFTTNEPLLKWAGGFEALQETHVGAARFDFENRSAVREGRWFVGDAVQVVPPFVGDGMAMALEGGELVARCLITGGWDAEAYASSWRAVFAPRIRVAKLLHPLLWKGALHEAALWVVSSKPGIAQWLYRNTRGSSVPRGLANSVRDC